MYRGRTLQARVLHTRLFHNRILQNGTSHNGTLHWRDAVVTSACDVVRYGGVRWATA